MDQALKQRLTGATVLIILGVVLLPMLLSGQPDLQNEPRKITVPDKPPELSFETRRFPVGQPPTPPETDADLALEPRPAIPAVDPAAIRAEAAARAGSAGEMAVGEGDSTGAVADEPVTSTPATGAADREQDRAEQRTGRYLVQVASFSNTSNANHLASVLRENGLPVVMDTVETNAGTLHRVRLGPYDAVAAANGAMQQIEALMSDLNPRVVDLRPDEGATVTDPSDPLVRWVVQAGSFAERENAQVLVDELQSAGFSAYIATVRGNGATAHKVRVGPLVERPAAVEVAADLRSRMGIEGYVMSVD